MNEVSAMKSLFLVSAEDIKEYLNLMCRATKLGAIVSLIDDARGTHFAIDYGDRTVYKKFLFDAKNYINFLEKNLQSAE